MSLLFLIYKHYQIQRKGVVSMRNSKILEMLNKGQIDELKMLLKDEMKER